VAGGVDVAVVSSGNERGAQRMLLMRFERIGKLFDEPRMVGR
jgi:hypothetical protein